MKFFLLISLLLISACKPHNDYLLLRTDKNGNYFYVNTKGETVIGPGKYSMCYTDTFRNFAVVSKSQAGLIGINRNEDELFRAFIFDNGPDYFSDGYFRIIKKDKIGYADKNGVVRIVPQFGCAFPFESGVAKVSNDCKTETDGEHSTWISDAWFYIDKTGKRVIGLDAEK